MLAALTRVPEQYRGFKPAESRFLVESLNGKEATLEAGPELDSYRRWIEPLDIEVSLATGLEMQQGPNAARRYASTRDADDVLHYAWLLGKIEYFGADEVSAIAEALRGFGPRYTAKVAAIRNWLETDPFG